MFKKSAAFYDEVFISKGKDYSGEIVKLNQFIQTHANGSAKTLLEIACGTGAHTIHLYPKYEVTGLDLDPGLLETARDRFPTLQFHEGSMVDFDLGQSFDLITCLASAIGYVCTVEKLNQTIQTFARHLRPGGMMLIEPWLTPDQYSPGKVFSFQVDKPDLKVTRMNVNVLRDNISVLEFHYLIGTPEGIEHSIELHELGLFTLAEYQAAFDAAGLISTFDPKGLVGRGLYIAHRPE
jgi:ubiquinone/menaquinone biosynthesis C-methylase UbiE